MFRFDPVTKTWYVCTSNGQDFDLNMLTCDGHITPLGSGKLEAHDRKITSLMIKDAVGKVVQSTHQLAQEVRRAAH